MGRLFDTLPEFKSELRQPLIKVLCKETPSPLICAMFNVSPGVLQAARWSEHILESLFDREKRNISRPKIDVTEKLYTFKHSSKLLLRKVDALNRAIIIRATKS